VALGAALAAGPAAAQPARAAPVTLGRPPSPAVTAPVKSTGADVEGAVLALQGDDLIVDLGATRGASAGVTVEIWRPIKLKHPVTGKVLTDRFRIGSLELTQVRPTMALARATAPLSRPASVGDVVVLVAPVPAAASVTPPEPSAAPPSPHPLEPTAEDKPPEDPEAVAVTRMFDALRGADLWMRIRRYEEYVRARPTGRFSPVLLEEAAALRELVTQRGKVISATGMIQVRSFAEPREALAGAPLRIAIELDDLAAGAVIQVRRRGAPSYLPFPMSALGNGYFAATIPADRVLGPGLEYFIEGVAAGGKASLLVGTPDLPRDLEVFETPRPYAPRKLPSHVELSTDYADYNRLRGNDYASQTEGSFGVRYGDLGVKALRAGFGVYRGVGGSVHDLDALALAPRSVGLTYGWLEAEIGVVHAFSFGGRVAVGLLDDGISGGGQLMLRIGSDLGTNLMIGGEVLGGLGLRGFTQLELATFERFPILLRTEVTNQPAGVTPGPTAVGTSTGSGDIGGRGIVQLGFKITPDLVIAVRGSFQGRTIQHAGPGAGGAVGYTW